MADILELISAAIRWLGHQSANPDHLFEPLYVALTRAKKSEVACVWSRADDDTDLWEGSCGVSWSIPGGTPDENEMNYCPRCGAKLETQQPKESK